MYFTAPSEEATARVKRAVDAFDVRIRNLYEPLAQVLTGTKRTKVKPHKTSSMTDGTTIWLAVPMALGDDTPHQKELCGLRDEFTKVMLCPMCEVIDSVDADCFHETFHIVGESFKGLTPYERFKALERIVRMKFPDDPEKLSTLLSKVSSMGTDAMRIASGLDLYLPSLTNIVEDVFVNEDGFLNRPGTIDPMVASSRKYLTGSWETAEGWTSWAERDINARAMIAVYCLGSGFEYAIPGFGSDLEPIVSDERIVAAIKTAHEQPSAVDRLMLAIEILGYLRDHDVCVDSRSELFEPKTPRVIILTDKEEDDDSEDSEPSEPIEVDEDDVIIDMRTKPDPGEGSDDEDGDESDDEHETKSSGGGEADDEDSDEEGSDDAEADDEGEDDSPDGDGGKTADRRADGEENEESEESLDESGSGSKLSDDAASESTTPKSGSDEMSPPSEADDEESRAREVELAEAAAADLDRAMGHELGEMTPAEGDDMPTREEREVLDVWLDQKDYFDEPSFGCKRVGFLEKKPGRHSGDLSTAPSATDINPVLTKLRVAFTKNQAMGISRNLTRGPRLDTAHLYRAPLGDPRLYARRAIPKKRNWFVVIGLDCSGSTAGREIDTIRKGGFAMGELLSRLGIPFAMYGHSGDSAGYDKGYRVTFTHVKNPNEPWDDASRSRCIALPPQTANLDGHTLEYYRRVAEQYKATDKLIMYFTDGSMPCENHDEEERILRKNIAICQRKDIKLVGVGVGNVEPRKYGLDTIRYDNLRQLPYLVDELGKRLV